MAGPTGTAPEHAPFILFFPLFLLTVYAIMLPKGYPLFLNLAIFVFYVNKGLDYRGGDAGFQTQMGSEPLNRLYVSVCV